MTQDKIKRIHRWYSWILAAVLAVLGVLFIVSCLEIYFSGPRPYSAESIALRFDRIRIPIGLTLLGIVGSIVLNILYPQKHQGTKGTYSDKDIMLRLRKKADIPPDKKEICLRRKFRMITAALFAALMIYPTIYILKLGSFTIANLNADVIRAVLVILPPSIMGLMLCWCCQARVNASYRREAAIYKQALADGLRASGETVTEPAKTGYEPLPAIQITLVVVAVICIGVGFLNGGGYDVLKKAVAICTECIGLG